MEQVPPRHSIYGLPPPGRLNLIVAVPVGGWTADDLPPDVHFGADGRVATVVFEGAGPDEAVVAALAARLAAWKPIVTAAPDCSPPNGVPA